MSDFYGPLALPAPAPGPNDTLTDPALDTLLSFFTAILNHHGGDAWRAVNNFQEGGDNVVNGTFTFDPEDEYGTEFNSRDLPGLFIFRKDIGGSAWLAADYYVRASEVTLLYVFPPAPQVDRARWRPFINLIASVLDGITDPDGRDPSWVVPGDPDPASAYLGSLLWKYLPNLYEFSVEKTEQHRVRIKMADASPQEHFPCVRMKILLRERNTVGEPPDDYFGLNGIDVNINDAGSGDLPAPISYDVPLGIAVASIAPSSGPASGGTAFTLEGIGFDDTPLIEFDDAAALDIEVFDGTAITGITPASSGPGIVTITVSNSNGDSSSLSSAFTFT